MRQHHIFWISSAVRMGTILLMASILGVFAGPMYGLILAVFGMMFLVVIQLRYLLKLSDWLDDPSNGHLPDGWGAWSGVFSRLYKLHRHDQKNQIELSEWLARFRQAMFLMPDGVVIMDDVMFLEWCNPLAEQHLGLNLSKDKGMRVSNLVRTPEFIDYVVLGRYEKPLSLSFRDRKLVLHIIPFENRRQILVTHDVTEIARIDMMRRDFIANASHELRTPLTVINGFLEINASQPDLDASVRQSHIQLMADQGKRMQRLVEEMLTLSSLESTEVQIRPDVIFMRPLLNNILEEAKALSSGEHTIELEVTAPNMRGNADEIQSAFSNLVSNAVRYTPANGVIQLSWALNDKGPYFSVKDNGIGIGFEHIGRLTERFYRVDKSRSRETQGTGLGLAIVKHVLHRHQAHLDVESTPNEGSLFTAQFPLKMMVNENE